MSAERLVVKLHCQGEDADAIAARSVVITGEAVHQEGPGLVNVTVTDTAAAEALLEELRHSFAEIEATIAAAPTIDWASRWRDGIEIRRLGRLVLAPSWLASDAPERSALVVIDPGMAFGSGEHGSTRAALRLLERHLVPNSRVLDCGSGSGILSIAAIRLGARCATGIELDADAVPVAESNAQQNGVATSVRFIAGDVAELAPLVGPVEIACSNILREPNLELLPAIAAALVPGGIAIFSGMEAAEAGEFGAGLAAAGWESFDDVVDDGWWAVAARRPE